MFKLEKNISFIFTIFFWLIAILELLSEFYENKTCIIITKGILLPILIVIYLINSKVKSSLYTLALILNFGANIFFVFYDLKYIILASLFLILSRTLLVIKIHKIVKLPSLIPALIGSLPFLILFLILLNLVYENIPFESFCMSLAQVALITVLGGFSLGNYIIKNDDLSGYLLTSTLFFAVSLFIIGIKFYYLDINLLKPLSMLFFIVAHYVLYQFILLCEKKEAKNLEDSL